MGIRTGKHQRRVKRQRREAVRQAKRASNRVADAVLQAAAGREVFTGEDITEAQWERVRQGDAVWLRTDGQGGAVLIDQGAAAVAAARQTPGEGPLFRRVV